MKIMAGKMKPSRCQTGISLIEVMIGLVLGLIVAAGLVTLVANTSRTRNELAKTNQQIENGRYAMQLLNDDIMHAGFYGDFVGQKAGSEIFTTLASLPDACGLNLNPATPPTLLDLLQFPVQGLNDISGTLPWTSCVAAGLVAAGGTDILAVRHAHRQAVCADGDVTHDDYYLQSEFTRLDIQRGASSAITYGTHNAAGSNSLMCKFFRNPDASCGTQSIIANTIVKCANAAPLSEQYIAATIRKLESNVYFIGTYNGAPALMMLRLGPTGYTVEPMVEGIEDMQIEYGIDNDASTKDGSPDVWKDSPTVTELLDVVALRVHLLARTLEASGGQADPKTYTLGTKSVVAPGDGFKRHVFSATVPVKNIADRKTEP